MKSRRETCAIRLGACYGIGPQIVPEIKSHQGMPGALRKRKDHLNASDQALLEQIPDRFL